MTAKQTAGRPNLSVILILSSCVLVALAAGTLFLGSGSTNSAARHTQDREPTQAASSQRQLSCQLGRFAPARTAGIRPPASGV